MKWATFAVFAVAFVCSVLWLDSAERKLTPSGQAAIGVIALTGWIAVIVLATAIL